MVRVYAHLHAIDFLRTIKLVVHPEEGGNRHYIAQQEVEALSKFAETRVD